MSTDHVTNFTVGPAKLYHGATEFLCGQLQRGVGEISHRSKDFSELSEQSLSAFREFFQVPDEYRVYYTYSATEGMEILTRSAIDEKSYHIVNGNFGNVWFKTAGKAQKTAQKLSHDDGKTRVEPEEIQPQAGTELLAITANETSTGIAYSPAEIAALRARFPELLLGVDVTSSMGAVGYDLSQADAWLFSVQKAFGLPAGLGILVVGPRVWEKAQSREAAGADVGCHHRLSDLEKKMAGKFQTPTTPNTLNIGGLGYVCQRLKADFGSLTELYTHTQKKAEAIYAFFENHPTLKPAIGSGRSESIIVVDGDPDELAALHKQLGEAGIEVGKGYGGKKAEQIRIGNFPVHSMADFEHLFAQIGGNT